MAQMEKEVWGQLTHEQFDEKLLELKEKFGEPKKFQRLAIQITDYDRKDLDTRIRVDHGKVRIMQKIGDWNAEVREEVELEVPVANSKDVVKLYQLLNNLVSGEHISRMVMQFENYVFDEDDFEIKLTRQFGLQDVYSFEVEVKNTEHSPIEIAREYSLEPDLEEKDDKYWKDFSEKINISVDDIEKSELESIISKYLK